MMVPGVLAFGSLARAFAVVIILSFPDAPGRCEPLVHEQNLPTTKPRCQGFETTRCDSDSGGWKESVGEPAALGSACSSSRVSNWG